MAAWSSEAKVGLFVLLAVVIFVLGILFLEEYRFEGSGYGLKVRFANVRGLTEGDPVDVAGLKVGSVKAMSLRDGQVEVLLWIHAEIKLPSDSRFAIRSAGALGDRLVSITPGTAPELLADGDTVRGATELDVADLLVMAEPLNQALQSILKDLSNVLDRQSQENLKASISSVRSITDRVDQDVHTNLQDLRATLNNLNVASSELRQLVGSQNKEDLDGITQDVKTAAESLKQSSQRLDRSLATLERVLDKTESGQGTLAKLINEKDLYEDLHQLIRHFDELVEDWKANPRKYVNVEVF